MEAVHLAPLRRRDADILRRAASNHCCAAGHGPAAVCAAICGAQLCHAEGSGGACAGRHAAAGRLCSTDSFSRVRSSHVLQQWSTCALDSRVSPLQGKPGEAVPKLKQDWKDAIVANWKLWPVFQFVNFRFVPPEQRVRSLGRRPCQMQSVFLLHVSSTLGSQFYCLHTDNTCADAMCRCCSPAWCH